MNKDICNAKYTIPYSEYAYKHYYGRKYIVWGIVWLFVGFVGFVIDTILNETIGEWWTLLMSISFMFLLFAAPLSFSMYGIEKRLAKKQKLYVFDDNTISVLKDGEYGVFFTQKDIKNGWIRLSTILKAERIKLSKQYVWIYGDIVLEYLNYGKEAVTRVNKIQIPRIYNENMLMDALGKLKEGVL